MDFIQEHKKVVIIVGVIVLLVAVMFGVRAYNLGRRASVDNEPEPSGVVVPSQGSLSQDVVQEKEPTDEYQNRLGLDSDKYFDERVPVREPEETTPPPIVVKKDPRYTVEVEIFDNTAVPAKGMDGSSFTGYLDKVKLADFGTFWGSSLNEMDLDGHKRYFVGVREKDYNSLTNLESAGWLISNLDSLEQNDAIKFTNLHVIGSLSKSHVALLCVYDWYSAFGLKDTLVMFEDISGTLSVDDFSEGDVFSATVFVHNIKIMENVQNQRVIVCEYSTYDKLLEEQESW